jgi:hypothetical protein
VQIGSATVRVGGNTELTFSELDDERIRLRLNQGSVALHLRRDELARDVAVHTPHGRFEPLRAGQYRIDVQDRSVFGATVQGAMRYESRDSALTIDEGQRAEFWKEQGDRSHYAFTDMPRDAFADWVRQQDREDRDHRYGRDRDDRDRDGRWTSPEMTGADDLYRHGQWDRHPEFGTIWYPHSVGAGWAPYRDGRWAYVRPWGWTWIDNAPWGFAPFHYGRWVQYRGRWGWAPGQSARRPVYAPALVGWIGHSGSSGVNISINIGGPGYVGWVPLSPYDAYVPHYHVPVTPVYINNLNSPYQRWHRQPQRDRPHIMQGGGVQYTNQGVAGGVTVVAREVLRQRTPISAAVIAPVAPAAVSNWQRVQPEAPVMINPPGNPARVAPPVVRSGDDDGREGPRRGGTVKSVAPVVQAPAPPSPSSSPVVVMPAQTIVRPPPAPPGQGAAIPPAAPASRPVPVMTPAVPAVPAVPVERVQPPPRPTPQQVQQERKDRQRDEREAREQSKEERREQLHRMQRHDPPGKNREN